MARQIHLLYLDNCPGDMSIEARPDGIFVSFKIDTAGGGFHYQEYYIPDHSLMTIADAVMLWLKER